MHILGRVHSTDKANDHCMRHFTRGSSGSLVGLGMSRIPDLLVAGFERMPCSLLLAMDGSLAAMTAQMGFDCAAAVFVVPRGYDC